MICPMTVRLGVYTLGAADAAERALVESHLDTCQVCRAELDRLAPLPGLLAQVPVDLIKDDPLPAGRPGQVPAARAARAGRAPAGKARAAATRWRRAAGVAAAAALAGAAAGLLLAQPGAGQPAAYPPPAAITLSGANPATHVQVSVTLTATSWGTSIRLRASGLPLNQPCRLIVRSRSGATEVTGAWDAWRAGPVSIPASAAWRPADIASLRVATASKNLVTVTAVRPGAHDGGSSSRR
jgi:hypothetical protein